MWDWRFWNFHCELRITSFQVCKCTSLFSDCHLHDISVNEGTFINVIREWHNPFTPVSSSIMGELLEVFVALYWLQRKHRQLVKARLNDKIKLSFQEVKLGQNYISTLLSTNPALNLLVFWKQSFITFEIVIVCMLLECEWWKIIRHW